MITNQDWLDCELAAYSPQELGELVGTVKILLEAVASDAPSDLAAHSRIEAALRAAVTRRLEAEERAGRTAQVVDLRSFVRTTPPPT